MFPIKMILKTLDEDIIVDVYKFDISDNCCPEALVWTQNKWKIISVYDLKPIEKIKSLVE